MSAQLRFAVVAAAVALLAEVVLTQVREISAYSILVGAVALAVWYGGDRPCVAVRRSDRLARLADEVIETSFATLVYADLDPETGAAATRLPGTRRRSWCLLTGAPSTSTRVGAPRSVPA